MASPTTQASVHDAFQNRSDELVKQANDQADAAIKPAKLRPWQVPNPVETLDDVSKAFDRTEIGDNYARAVASATSPGTTGDIASLKLQSDWAAALERAFRARHSGIPRLIAMAAARRKGHGNKLGPIGSVARYAQTAIAAGGKKA